MDTMTELPPPVFSSFRPVGSPDPDRSRLDIYWRAADYLAVGRSIHRLTYRRSNHENFHVHEYREERTTTTPFDMVMLNDPDRFRLVIDVLDRVPHFVDHNASLRQEMIDARFEARAYTRRCGEDPPEISEWTWSPREDAAEQNAAGGRRNAL